jgi:glutathione synthase/RimK-type ligase-like ATP-grasp enzyme
MVCVAIIGGEKDFNLIRLVTALADNKIDLKLILFGDNSSHKFHYDLKAKQLLVNGDFFKPTAVFNRTDVFKYLETNDAKDDDIARNWKQAFSAWLLANQEVKVFNRNLLANSFFQKIYALHLAQELNIPIPDTFISNSINDLNPLIQKQKMIYKPISGGDYTKELKEFDLNIYREGVTRSPLICQNYLQYPELRVFKVGSHFFSFEINSELIDYRENNQANSMRCVPNDEALIEKLDKLNSKLGLNFSACDLKYCNLSQEFKFLEINTSPMFAGFDRICNGQICDAMIEYLVTAG